MEIYELGRVQNILKAATGLEVTHAYDDLVFVEHAAFLIQFVPQDLKRFQCHFNEQCVAEDRVKLLARIQTASASEGMACDAGRTFTLEQVPDKEEVRIHFL